MTRFEFFAKLTHHLELPFKPEDVDELQVSGGSALITVHNHIRPYMISVYMLPIESDYDDENKVNILTATKPEQP